MSAGALAYLAADTSFNTMNISLIGLAQTGIEYIPVVSIFPHRLSKSRCNGTRMEPTPIYGGAGVLGSGLAGFLKGYPTTQYADAAPQNPTLPNYMLILP